MKIIKTAKYKIIEGAINEDPEIPENPYDVNFPRETQRVRRVEVSVLLRELKEILDPRFSGSNDAKRRDLEFIYRRELEENRHIPLEKQNEMLFEIPNQFPPSQFRPFGDAPPENSLGDNLVL